MALAPPRPILAALLALALGFVSACGSGDHAAPVSAANAEAGWRVPSTILQPLVAEPAADATGYARSEWRHWIDVDGDCQDTRQEALVAESRVPVTYEAGESCRVATGEWLDPYTGIVVANPRSLDVDHMVPLENAHRSGGWRWTPAEKQAYANDLDDPDHLIAVTASANRSKGSHGPEEWKPPLADDWCRYAVDWVEIKDRWSLTVTAAEWSALVEMLDTCPGGSPLVIPPAPLGGGAVP